MRKLFKNRKALSPVIAAIILIAVTVAVSIAVAAWMGALTFTFMGYEEIDIAKVEFPSENVISATIKNTGSRSFVLAAVYINDERQNTYSPTEVTIPIDGQLILNITYVWAPGYSYQIKLRSTQEHYFSYDTAAPVQG